VSVDGGQVIWMKVNGDPRNHYIARMDWSESSQEIIFQRLNRLQNTNQVTMGNVVTGETRIILEDKDDTWVEMVEDLHWLEGGKTFTWVSERDGWRHAYQVSRKSGDMKIITPTDFDLTGIAHIDEKGGWLYFIASPQNPAQRYLYRIPLGAPGGQCKIPAFDTCPSAGHPPI